MISSRLIKSNNAAAGCVDIVDAYDPFDGNGVALYQLNGNANDVSGNYNGTASNVTYGTGVFGQAGVFNGSSGKIELPTNVFSFSSFTLSGWVNVNANTDENTLFEIEDSNNYPNYTTIVISGGSIGGNNARFLFRNYLANQFDFSPTGNSTTLGWRQYVMTYDGSTINCYINGVIVQTASFSLSNPIGSITGVRLGLSSGSRYLNGSIDQVRIFNTALDPLEVEALYIEESCLCGGTVDTLDILDDSSCIALYPLDGNANDLSGNYSGTPTAVSYGAGEFDLAGVFNGSSSKVVLDYSALRGTTLSVSLWFKTTSSSFSAIIDSQAAASSSKGFGLYLLSNGTLELGFSGGSGSNKTQTSLSYNDGLWHNATIVFNLSNSGNNAFLYIDNNLVITLAVTVWTSGDSTYPIALGVAQTNYFFNGSIDQVRIFNKALNSTEVTTLYNETACTQTTGGTVPDPVSLTDTGVTKTGNMSINVRGFAISDNGRYLALNNYTAGNLEEWDMSTPYNLSTATLSEEFISAGYDILYSSDGNYFYTQNIDFNYVLYYYQLTTTNGGWVGNHGSKTSTGYNMIRSNENTLGVSIDGEFFWYINNDTKIFYKSFFSTPFDPSTLGSFEAYPLPSLLQYVYSLRFTNQGNRIYFTQVNNPSAPGDESIYVYNLSSPYNLNSTLTYVNNFTNDTFVTKFWAISDNEGKIYTTTKSSAYTIKEFNVNT